MHSSLAGRLLADLVQAEASKTDAASTEPTPCSSCGSSPGHKFSCPKLERNCVMPLGMRKGTRSDGAKKES